jgi:hypothetical protein
VTGHATTDRVPRKRLLTEPLPIPPSQHMGRSTHLRDERARWHILSPESLALCGRQRNIGEIATFAGVVALRGRVCNECHRRFSWRPLPHEFLEVDRGYETACKVWKRGTDAYGYARRGKPERGVHREAYEAVHGAVPKGFQVHHLCGQKDCINTDHMKALSLLEHRAQHRTFDYEEAASLWRQGWSFREIGEAVGAGRSAVMAAIYRMRDRGEL